MLFPLLQKKREKQQTNTETLLVVELFFLNAFSFLFFLNFEHKKHSCNFFMLLCPAELGSMRFEFGN